MKSTFLQRSTTPLFPSPNIALLDLTGHQPSRYSLPKNTTETSPSKVQTRQSGTLTVSAVEREDSLLREYVLGTLPRVLPFLPPCLDRRIEPFRTPPCYSLVRRSTLCEALFGVCVSYRCCLDRSVYCVHKDSRSLRLPSALQSLKRL